MTLKITIRDIAFVLRCSGAATVAYVLAGSALGLVHPVWAAVSAIVVSQEKRFQTRKAVVWRFAGTIVGIVIAVTAGTLTTRLGWDIAAQMGVSVALSAVLVRRWPDLKVAMWTAPIVFFSNEAGTSLVMAGYARGSEVIPGGVIGAITHWIAERIITPLEAKAGSAADT